MERNTLYIGNVYFSHLHTEVHGLQWTALSSHLRHVCPVWLIMAARTRWSVIVVITNKFEFLYVCHLWRHNASGTVLHLCWMTEAREVIDKRMPLH